MGDETGQHWGQPLEPTGVVAFIYCASLSLFDHLKGEPCEIDKCPKPTERSAGGKQKAKEKYLPLQDTLIRSTHDSGISKLLPIFFFSCWNRSRDLWFWQHLLLCQEAFWSWWTAVMRAQLMWGCVLLSTMAQLQQHIPTRAWWNYLLLATAHAGREWMWQSPDYFM